METRRKTSWETRGTKPREGGHTINTGKQEGRQWETRGGQDLEMADAPPDKGTHVGRQWETRGDKTLGRGAHHPTQAHMRGDNGRQKETRPREGGSGETMGDKGGQGLLKADLVQVGDTIQHRRLCGETMGGDEEPSSTGTHVGREWQTTAHNCTQGETGRQEGTMGDNGQQVETRARGSG